MPSLDKLFPMSTENHTKPTEQPQSDAPAQRRTFVKQALLGGLAAASLSGCIKRRPKGERSKGASFRWRLAMIVPKTLPLWGPAIQQLADNIRVMSDGRLDIKVYGAGELFPAYDVFDRVRSGQIQMGHSAAYCWQGKIKASVFFTSIPFGLNTSGMQAWLQHGGGQELWDELYAPYGVKSLACGNTGVQMGGWFNKKIETVEDFQGLKIRMPGLGGKVMSAAGAQPIDIPGGEILTSLQTGVIDATEWIGPYHDQIMGFHKAAKYYYSGGWHEPGSVLELLINRKAWDSLPPDLKAIVHAAAAQTNASLYAAWTQKDAEAYHDLQQNSQVEVLSYPQEVTRNMKQHAQQVIQDLIEQDPRAQKIYSSFKSFQDKHQAYQDISELAYAKSVRS